MRRGRASIREARRCLTAIDPKKLFINNEWRDAAGGKTMDVINPGDRGGHRDGRRRRTRPTSTPRSTAARAAFDGPVGARCRRASADGWSGKLGERLMERADEIARLETLHNGKPIFESRQIEIPAAAECFEYYAGWADKVHGRDDPGQGQLPHLHAARAGRRRRRDRAVEFPAAAGGVEGRAGAGVRQHGHPQAGEPDAADGARARRDRASRSGCRPACSTSSPARARASARRSSSIPASTRSRSPATRATGKGDHARRRRHAEADHARARRQVAEHRLRRRRSRRGACAARRPASSTARAKSAPPARGCSSTSRSRTSSSTSSPRARRRWSPAIRWIRRRGSARSSSKKQLETRAALHRDRQEGRRDARRRRRPRRHRHRQGLLPPADGLRRRHAGDDDRARGDLRAGARGDRVRRRRRGDRARQRLAATAWPPAVWTRDIKKAHYVARKLQAGTVWINTYNVYDTAAPFGGYKQSGFGREMSAHALEHYTQVKSVWVDLNL